MVKCKVSQIINQISDDEAYPKYYSKAAIVRVNKWIDGVVSNSYEDYCKYGWEDQPVTKYYILNYGSTGSIWWIPCSRKCRYLTILLSARYFSEWKRNLWRIYSNKEKLNTPIIKANSAFAWGKDYQSTFVAKR
jgi:hypothetical protein